MITENNKRKCFQLHTQQIFFTVWRFIGSARLPYFMANRYFNWNKTCSVFFRTVGTESARVFSEKKHWECDLIRQSNVQELWWKLKISNYHNKMSNIYSTSWTELSCKRKREKKRSQSKTQNTESWKTRMTRSSTHREQWSNIICFKLIVLT